MRSLAAMDSLMIRLGMKPPPDRTFYENRVFLTYIIPFSKPTQQPDFREVYDELCENLRKIAKNSPRK